MNLRKTLMAASSLLFLLPAFAEGDGYVRLKTSTSYKEGYGFAKAEWSKPVEDPSVTDYLVTDGKIFSTAYKEGSVPAKSITFGEVGGNEGHYRAYYGVTYTGSDGLIFANGTCWAHLASAIIDADLTIVSPETKPFCIYSDGYREGVLRFTGDLTASKGCGVIVRSGFYSVAEGNNPFTLEFTGNVSSYQGSMIVTSRYDSVGAAITAVLRLSGSATYFGGALTIGKDAIFNPQVVTSVGSLTLKKGAAIELSSETTLEVRDSLILEENALIKLTGAPKSIVSELTRCALITMPAGSESSIENFIIEDGSTSYCTKAKLELITSEDGKTKTLYATYFPAVENILDNKAAHDDPNSESAENEGKYWDDEQPVHSGAHYFVNKLNGRTTYFTTRYAPQDALSFEGESLHLDAYTCMRLRIGDFSIPYMECSGSTVAGLESGEHILRSKFDVTGWLIVEPRKGGSIKLIGPITGKETAVLKCRGESASTSSCRGTVELDGDNTGYPGKVNATLEYPNKLSFNHYFTSLIVRRAENLGGARSAFAFDALQIDSGSRLEVLDSFELAEPTRGIFISSIGRILVAEDKELTVNQQLTVNGRFYKEGAGTLALGGDLRFLEFDTNIVEKVDGEGATKLVTNITSTVVETIPNDAANRTFYVMGGKVKPLTAYALDGLDVVFSNKTSKLDVGFALDIKSTDEELRAKGICNVKSPAPFAFFDDDAQKKAPIYLECNDETPATEYSFNVMTVKAECADALNLFKIVLPQSLTHLKLTTTKVADTDAGTVTLSAKLKKYGFAISIR